MNDWCNKVVQKRGVNTLGYVVFLQRILIMEMKNPAYIDPILWLLTYLWTIMLK